MVVAIAASLAAQNQDPDPPENWTPTFNGVTRARWEGGRLVVDTVGFFDKSFYDFAGTPHTKDTHLTEQFHRVNYGNMEIQLITDAPGVFTNPCVINPTAT